MNIAEYNRKLKKAVEDVERHERVAKMEGEKATAARRKLLEIYLEGWRV